MNHKFGSLTPSGWMKHRYGNVFRHDVRAGWSRVTLATDEHPVSLMLDIAKQWPGPYGILYVLTVSRLGHEHARYQCPTPCSFDELQCFAHTFQDFLEGDARHHVWFMDVSTGCQLIYDTHNRIYSYGDDDGVIRFLKTRGFHQSDLKIPAPHQHCFNQEFDRDEDRIMTYFQWEKSPLHVEHDD